VGVGGQHHAPTALSLGKRFSTQFRGVQVGPRAGLDGCRKSCLHQYSTPGPSCLQQVTIPTTLFQPIFCPLLFCFDTFILPVTSHHKMCLVLLCHNMCDKPSLVNTVTMPKPFKSISSHMFITWVY
jgi:hypothetical protein